MAYQVPKQAEFRDSLWAAHDPPTPPEDLLGPWTYAKIGLVTLAHPA